MLRYNELADRYTAMWAIGDPDGVREEVAALFTEDAEYVNPVRHVKGHEEIVAQVAFAQDYYAERGSYDFTGMHDAVGLADTMRFGWVLRHGETGEAVSTGVNFFVLSDDGRISRAYQYTERPPLF